jgi:hypothetical protein
MKRFLAVIVVLVVGVVGFGFYRGWFRVSTSDTERGNQVKLDVDKEKIKEDRDKAGAEIKDVTGDLTGKAKKSSGSDRAGGEGKAPRQEYERQADEKLKALERQFDELKARVEKATAESRPGLDERMEALRKKKEAARKKLDDLKAAGAATWEDGKAGVEAALDDWRKAYEDLRSKLP